MRVPVVIAAAIVLAAVIALPSLAQADVTVEVPGAVGTYVYGQPQWYPVTADFGGPLVDVIGLKIHWRGIGTLGRASCDGQEPSRPWSPFFECDIAGEDVFAPHAWMWLPDGVFDCEGSFSCPNGYAFLESGTVDLYFQFADGPADCEEYLTVFAAPQCTLNYVALSAVTTVPVANTTWGAVKSLYGR